jgi:hypothetical protein
MVDSLDADGRLRAPGSEEAAMTDQNPQVQSEGGQDPTVQPTGEGEFPIGMGMPFPEFPHVLPRPLWEAHTSESWARAIQAELLQQTAQPISGVTVDPEKPFDPHSTVFEENIKFACVNLGDGKIGFAVSFRHVAAPGKHNWVHYLVELGR